MRSMRHVLTNYLDSHAIAYDFRETIYPLWFNLGRKVEPYEVDLFPAVSVNLPSPHNNSALRRSYRPGDEVLCKVMAVAYEDGTRCDLLAVLRDDEGQMYPLPDRKMTPDTPERLVLDKGKPQTFFIQLPVREVPAFAGLKRDTEFEFIVGLADPGTLEFHNRLHSQWFIVSPR